MSTSAGGRGDDDYYVGNHLKERSRLLKRLLTAVSSLIMNGVLLVCHSCFFLLVLHGICTPCHIVVPSLSHF